MATAKVLHPHFPQNLDPGAGARARAGLQAMGWLGFRAVENGTLHRPFHSLACVINHQVKDVVALFGEDNAIIASWQVGIRLTHQAPTDCGLPSAFLRSG